MSYTHRLAVRFRDCDSLGHVNNAVYLTYLEEARTHWVLDLLRDRPPTKMPFILASAQIDYRSPALFLEELTISVSILEVRQRSFQLGYRISAGDRLVAEAQTALVTFDYETHKAIPIPSDLKDRLQAGVPSV